MNPMYVNYGILFVACVMAFWAGYDFGIVKGFKKCIRQQNAEAQKKFFEQQIKEMMGGANGQ
jgi:hypothetical protein